MSYLSGNPFVTNIVPLFNVANSASGSSNAVTNTEVTNLQSLLNYNTKKLSIDTITSFTPDTILQIDNNLNINGQLYINEYFTGPNTAGANINTCTSFSISTSITTVNVNSIVDSVLVPNFNIYMNGSNVFSINPDGRASFLNDITVRGISVNSDVRYKSDIYPLTNSLSTLCEFKGVMYNIDNISTLGLIAQDANKIIPNIVNKTNPEKWSVNYIQLIPVLIESIKELRQEIADLRSKLASR
jgi:hypothetical protein